MEPRRITRSAARTLDTLAAASAREAQALFRIGAVGVREAGLLVETVRLLHPELPSGGVEVDEADLIELCELRHIMPQVGAQLGVVGFRLCAGDAALAVLA